MLDQREKEKKREKQRKGDRERGGGGQKQRETASAYMPARKAFSVTGIEYYRPRYRNSGASNAGDIAV